MIFGMQSGRAEAGLRVEAGVPNSHGRQMFCHSPESFVALWEEVFGPGRVEARAALKVVERRDLPGYKPEDDGMKYYYMSWSVRRL